MNKQEFLLQLRKNLFGLPQKDIEERLSFYEEMIDDRMEEGCSEKEAILAIGPTEKIAAQIINETPLAKIAKERIKPKRKPAPWEIILLVLGSPIWLSLGIAAAAVILSLYISLWAIIISLWAVFGSLIGGSIGGLAAGSIFLLHSDPLTGCLMLSAGLICLGLSIFAFFGCKGATKGIVLLTKRIAFGTKNCIIKKEDAS